VVEKTRSSDKSRGRTSTPLWSRSQKVLWRAHTICFAGWSLRSMRPFRCSTGGIPWLIEMYEVRAMGLEVEAKLKIQNLKELEQLFRKTVWHP